MNDDKIVHAQEDLASVAKALEKSLAAYLERVSLDVAKAHAMESFGRKLVGCIFAINGIRDRLN